MPSKRQGLRLTLGGAPASPHVIAGLPGYYRPDIPTPVGGENDALSLEDARKAAKDHSGALELVEVDDVAKAEAVRDADLEEGRTGIPQALKDGRASDDESRTRDEQQAVKAAAPKPKE